MNTKLTLRLDQRLIRRAKAYARRTGRSVSQIVADYFRLLESEEKAEDMELTPTVRSRRGVLHDRDVNRAV